MEYLKSKSRRHVFPQHTTADVVDLVTDEWMSETQLLAGWLCWVLGRQTRGGLSRRATSSIGCILRRATYTLPLCSRH